MAASGLPRGPRLRWTPALVALALLLAPTLLHPDAAAQAQERDSREVTDLSVGTPVSYEAPDGSESLTLTIEEIIDPLETGLEPFDEERLSAEGKRYVAIRLRFENTAATAVPFFFTNLVQLLAADSFLYQPTTAFRDTEATEADPDFPFAEIPAGGSLGGLIFYELPQAAVVEAVLFMPSSDRLITLSARDAAAGPVAATSGDAAEVEVPPLPQPDLRELEASGTYASAQFGHRVSWDPTRWSLIDAHSEPRRDRLALRGDVVVIGVDALGGSDGDAEGCLVEQVYADLDEVSGFDGPPDDILPPTADSGLPPHAGLYLITRVDEDGRAHELVRYVECRTLLADEAVLRIVITAPERFWAIERGLAAAVLSTIGLPVGSPDVGSVEPLTIDPSPSPGPQGQTA